MRGRRNPIQKCIIDDCTQLATWKGMCGKHYKRNWRHGDPTIALVNFSVRECSVSDCHRQATNKEYCAMHATRMRRYGRLHVIKVPYGLGRTVNGAGYVQVTLDNGKRVYEHILCAEHALGKKLPSKAVVHHMNNLHWDNYTPFNLIVCPGQAYHLLLHKRAREYDLFGKCSREET